MEFDQGTSVKAIIQKYATTSKFNSHYQEIKPVSETASRRD